LEGREISFRKTAVGDHTQQRHERFTEWREGEADRPAACNLPEAEEESKGEQLPDDRTYDPAFLLHGVSSQNAAEKGSSARLRSIAPLQCGRLDHWSDALKPNTPILQLASLYIGEGGLERSQIPEVIDLEVLALDRTGETVEL
jgi:hypothetical protein